MDAFVNHFADAARFYVLHRPEYPDHVWDLLADEAGVDRFARVIELGCGPGTATLALARRASWVTAVDADASMLAEGEQLANAAAITNIGWIRAKAEDHDDQAEHYELGVIASAFHWMDRPAVAAKCHRWLTHGGVLAVVGNPTPLLQIQARQGVGAAIAHVQDKWALTDQLPLNVESLARPETILADSPFGNAVVHHVPTTQRWNVDRFLGFLQSTSSRPHVRLGTAFTEFARDIDTAIRSVEPTGEWTLDSSIEVIIARKP